MGHFGQHLLRLLSSLLHQTSESQTASSAKEPETGPDSIQTRIRKGKSVLSAKEPGGSTSRSETLFAFVVGDNMWDVLTDARSLAKLRGEDVRILYAGKGWDVHGEASDDALTILLAMMQRAVDRVD